MAIPDLPTIRGRIAWTYANLGRAHAALRDGQTRYRQLDHIIRARLFKGLRTGAMSMGALYDDERERMIAPVCCAYCGGTEQMSLDHLAPRLKEGPDSVQNLVHACRRCNSSKGSRDLLFWMEARGAFPSVFVLRRYLKLLAAECERRGVLDEAPDSAAAAALPFDLRALPLEFPPLASLCLHVAPAADPT